MKNKLLKILAKLFLVFLTLAILCVVSEFFFRLSKGKEFYLKNTTGSKKLRSPYLLEPNTIRRFKSSKKGEFDVTMTTNAFGFRGKEMALEKEKDTLRIFAVGDSFTLGVGAQDNETVPYHIEEKLTHKGYPIEVINAGRGNTTTLIHYLNLRDNYLKFKPDLVLLLFDFSDLEDDWYKERRLVYDEKGRPLYIDPTIIDGKRNWRVVLTSKSEFFQWINKKILRTFDKIRIIGFRNYIKAKMEGKRAKAVISNLEKEKASIDTIEYDHYLLIRGRDKLPQIKKHWQRTEKYLLMIRDLLKENDIPLILAIYPYGIHVGPDQWAEGRVYWGFEPGKTYDDYYAFDLIQNFAKKNNIAFINTLDDFLEEKDKPLFFDLDGHLNPQGNEILANSIIANKVFKDNLDNLLPKQ